MARRVEELEADRAAGRQQVLKLRDELDSSQQVPVVLYACNVYCLYCCRGVSVSARAHRRACGYIVGEDEGGMPLYR